MTAAVRPMKSSTRLMSRIAAGMLGGINRLAESKGASADRRIYEADQQHHDLRGMDGLCSSDLYYGSSVLIVDKTQLQGECEQWLASACLDTRRVSSLTGAGQLIDNGQRRVGLVIVDLDRCGGIARIASDLMVFRKVRPDIPVILVSADSVVDDFSTERLAIADVTLRAPVSMSRLDLALAEAQVNNQVWQARLAS